MSQFVLVLFGFMAHQPFYVIYVDIIIIQIKKYTLQITMLNPNSLLLFIYLINFYPYKQFYFKQFCLA